MSVLMLSAEGWSALISAGALTLSMVAIGVATWSSHRVLRKQLEFAEQQQQAAAFQRLHELLVAPEAAAGQRKLFMCKKAGTYPRVGQDGWDEINYSLALYDTLGSYVRHKFVDEEKVMLSWHDPLTRIAVPVEEFMAHRRELGIEQPWEFLTELIERAKLYNSGRNRTIQNNKN